MNHDFLKGIIAMNYSISDHLEVMASKDNDACSAQTSSPLGCLMDPLSNFRGSSFMVLPSFSTLLITNLFMSHRQAIVSSLVYGIILIRYNL